MCKYKINPQARTWKKVNKKWFPELYLIASVIFYWVSAANLLNPVAFCLLAVLAILFIVKNEILGIIISLLFLILSLFMVLALISELNEFAVFNRDAKFMLLAGATWLGLNITLAIVMLVKWGKLASHTQQELI